MQNRCAKWMMNFLGQMRGICLKHPLKKAAGPDNGSMKRRQA
jgi:hypothetical protein